MAPVVQLGKGMAPNTDPGIFTRSVGFNGTLEKYGVDVHSSQIEGLDLILAARSKATRRRYEGIYKNFEKICENSWPASEEAMLKYLVHLSKEGKGGSAQVVLVKSRLSRIGM